MSKAILNISLSFLVITCAITIWIGLFYAKPTFDRFLSMAARGKQVQEEIIQSAKEIKDVLFEAGLATAVIALSEQNIVPPTDAEKMIAESIDKIDKHSERLGKLAEYINDFRIKQERKKRR